MQTSVEGKHTVEAKHNFEAFANNCGVSIKDYHADDRISSSQTFKERFMSVQQT